MYLVVERDPVRLSPHARHLLHRGARVERRNVERGAPLAVARVDDRDAEPADGASRGGV